MLVASWTEGSAERMGGVLSDHGARRHPPGGGLARCAEAGRKRAWALACLGIEHGFEAPDFALMSEQDVLGDRMVRAQTPPAPGAEFPVRGLVAGAGRSGHPYRAWRGRYLGLKAIEALGAPHDCLELQYDGGKLFLPVENIELLTRYGSDEGARSSTAWAARAGRSARPR